MADDSSIETALFKQRAENLEASGYLRVLGQLAMNMAVPFWWSGRDDGGNLVISNGTLCLVDTGVKQVGITCDHVYQGYLDAKAKLTDLSCQFGNNTIDPEARLLHRSSVSDLAVFDVPAVFVSASPHNFHHSPLAWPPAPVTAGEVVVYGGYPQVLRHPGTDSVDFPFQWFASRVLEADSTRILLEPNLSTVYWPGHEGERINARFWGQSGGPVYRITEAGQNGANIDRLELVGFIDRQFQTAVLARPARHLSAMGEITE